MPDQKTQLEQELLRREMQIGPATGLEKPLTTTDFTQKRVGIGDFLEALRRLIIPDIEGAARSGDPLMGLGGDTPATAVTQFIRGGVPSRALREAATGDTLKRLRALIPPTHWERAERVAEMEKFVAKYPRVSAHMQVRKAPYQDDVAGSAWTTPADRAWTRRDPVMAGTDPGYTRIPVKFHGTPLEAGKTLAHEATHVAQALAMPRDFDRLYDFADEIGKRARLQRGAPTDDAGRQAYTDNPFERNARATESRLFGSAEDQAENPRVKNIYEALMQIGEADPDNATSVVPRWFDVYQTMLRRRGGE